MGFHRQEAMIDLSILIVNWNTKEYLLPCVTSIFQIQEGISRKVIVVDNGSHDGSGVEVKRTFSDVHLVENKRNEGFAKAVNQGLGMLSGRYALLLNPDTQLTKGAMEQLVSFMDAHSEVGIAGAQLLNRDGSRQNSIANFPSLTTELLNKSLLRRLFPKKFPGKEKDYPEPMEVDSVIGACMIVRRKAIDQVGYLDEDYFLFFEETDWCYRMKKAGWKVFHVPQAKIYHYQGKSVREKRRGREWNIIGPVINFLKKNRGKLQCVILLTGLLTKLGFQLIYFTFLCFFTLFSIKKWRRKLSIYAYLMGRHLKFCPKEMGLKEINGSLFNE